MGLTIANNKSVCFIKSHTNDYDDSRSDPGKNTVRYQLVSAVTGTGTCSLPFSGEKKNTFF